MDAADYVESCRQFRVSSYPDISWLLEAHNSGSTEVGLVLFIAALGERNRLWHKRGLQTQQIKSAAWLQAPLGFLTKRIELTGLSSGGQEQECSNSPNRVPSEYILYQSIQQNLSVVDLFIIFLSIQKILILNLNLVYIYKSDCHLHTFLWNALKTWAEGRVDVIQWNW